MIDTDRFKLLGTYRTPRVRVGRVLACEARDCDVVVTGSSVEMTSRQSTAPLGKSCVCVSVSRVYRVAAAEYWSATGWTSWKWVICSGAMYVGLPPISPWNVAPLIRDFSYARASPKSA